MIGLTRKRRFEIWMSRRWVILACGVVVAIGFPVAVRLAESNEQIVMLECSDYARVSFADGDALGLPVVPGDVKIFSVPRGGPALRVRPASGRDLQCPVWEIQDGKPVPVGETIGSR